MNTTQAGVASATNTGQAFGSSGYRNYVLFSLTFLYTLNFIDRILIGVVAQPIIEEFKLQDWQFGLLSGFGFALMYTVVGIPIARIAEYMNRVRIIAVSVIIWSLMTALCGIAGNFAWLLAFRVGVGIGEAGLSPAANSIIADYFPHVVAPGRSLSIRWVLPWAVCWPMPSAGRSPSGSHGVRPSLYWVFPALCWGSSSCSL